MSRVCLKNTFLDFKDEHDDDERGRARARSRSQDVSPASFELRRSNAEPADREEDAGDWSPSLLARYTEVLKNPSSPLTSPALGPRPSPFGMSDLQALHSVSSCPAMGSLMEEDEQASRAANHKQTSGRFGNEEIFQDSLEMVMNIEEHCEPAAPSNAHVPRPRFTANSGQNGPSSKSLLALHSVVSCPEMGSLAEMGNTQNGKPYMASPSTAGPYAPQYAPAAQQRGRHQAEDDYMRTREDALSPEALRNQRNNSGQMVPERGNRTGSSSPAPQVEPGTTGPAGVQSSSSTTPGQPGQYRHNHVPKSKNLVEEYGNTTDGSQPITTLMIRNIPNRYSQRDLIEEIDELGFGGTYDFLYLPMDKGTLSNVGYAFVNFVDASWGERGMDAFKSYRFKRYRKQSGKIATVSVAHIQGLENNLKHYQHTAVKDAREKQHRPMVIPSIQRALQVGTADSFEGSIDDL